MKSTILKNSTLIFLSMGTTFLTASAVYFQPLGRVSEGTFRQFKKTSAGIEPIGEPVTGGYYRPVGISKLGDHIVGNYYYDVGSEGGHFQHRGMMFQWNLDQGLKLCSTSVNVQTRAVSMSENGEQVLVNQISQTEKGFAMHALLRWGDRKVSFDTNSKGEPIFSTAQAASGNAGAIVVSAKLNDQDQIKKNYFVIPTISGKEDAKTTELAFGKFELENPKGYENGLVASLTLNGDRVYGYATQKGVDALVCWEYMGVKDEPEKEEKKLKAPMIAASPIEKEQKKFISVGDPVSYGYETFLPATQHTVKERSKIGERDNTPQAMCLKYNAPSAFDRSEKSIQKDPLKNLDFKPEKTNSTTTRTEKKLKGNIECVIKEGYYEWLNLKYAEDYEGAQMSQGSCIAWGNRFMFGSMGKILPLQSVTTLTGLSSKSGKKMEAFICDLRSKDKSMHSFKTKLIQLYELLIEEAYQSDEQSGQKEKESKLENQDSEKQEKDQDNSGSTTTLPLSIPKRTHHKPGRTVSGISLDEIESGLGKSPKSATDLARKVGMAQKISAKDLEKEFETIQAWHFMEVNLASENSLHELRMVGTGVNPEGKIEPFMIKVPYVELEKVFKHSIY